MLEVSALSVRAAGRTLVDDIGFTLNDGEWLMIAGPNGAGKSTLIRALTRGVPYTGRILLNGRNIRTYPSAALAREMGALSQRHSTAYAFSVEEIVSLGRYAYSHGAFTPTKAEDTEQVECALRLTGMTKLRRQSVLTLSGGELQRAFLAQVFAQNPKLLILDEPTNHLDLQYQKQLFMLIRNWLEEPGRAVLSVVHDLSLARAYGTRALLMKEGRIVAQGAAQKVLNPENLARTYDMDVFEWMRSLLSQWQ